MISFIILLDDLQFFDPISVNRDDLLCYFLRLIVGYFFAELSVEGLCSLHELLADNLHKLLGIFHQWLLLDLVRNPLVNVDQPICTSASGAAARFFHDLLFTLNAHLVIVETEPVLILAIEDESVVVA